MEIGSGGWDCTRTTHADGAKGIKPFVLLGMKGWIENCRRSHQPVCMMPQQVGGPKRLLQCLPDGRSVRLVETESLPQPCYYITLFYCWGDGKNVKKTTENGPNKTLGLHQRGISDQSLPQLFQEAIALARGLDIPYLWIDSLCIIQDSQVDMDEELMKMSDIFRGALVVVVAASAESPLDSLLRKPQDQSHTWRTASLVSYQEMDLDVKFRKRAHYAHFCENATYLSPVSERAWCFQEKLLASRCLVFGDDEVVWECRSSCLCECGGEQERFPVRDNPEGLMTLERHQQMLLPAAEHQLGGTLKHFADAEAAYSFWKTAVENFSDRKLTMETDRLPAISAVASVIAEAIGDRYLAGLWRGDLLAGLGWYPDPGNAGPYQEYIAPTWSWASLPVGVRHARSHKTQHWRDANQASVLDAWTALKGANLYGPVSDGAVVLSGVHCDVAMTTQESAEMQLDFGHGEVETVCTTNYASCQSLDWVCAEPDANVHRLGENSRYLRRVTDGPAGGGQPACSGTVHLLWLEADICLILTPSRRRKGAYERLGIFYPELDEELAPEFNTPTMPTTVQPSSITLV